VFYTGGMISGALLREARRRAGLSQVELGRRVGRHQTQIARWERGAVDPSLETLRRLVDACNLELTLGLAAKDDSYSLDAAERLRLRPAARLGRAISAAAAVRSLRPQTVREGGSAPFDPLPVLERLEASGVQFVLVGALAGVLRGSPLLPVDATIVVVPEAHEASERLETALEGIGATRVAAGGWLAPGTRVVIELSPPGTTGYRDLRRDATRLEITPGLSVVTASLPDLVRIAEASPDPERHGQVGALRATLEVAQADGAPGNAGE
jgi:transcriptional regulator with XRE-family HTH domain